MPRRRIFSTGDETQLAFFTKEVKSKNKHSFLKIEDCEYEKGSKSLIVKFKWENANEALTNYFAQIGRPLASDGTFTDVIKIVETTDGDKLSFNWGLPRTADNNYMMASLHTNNDQVTAVNIRKAPNGKVIGELSKGENILADKNNLLYDFYRVYWVDDNGYIQQGFVKSTFLSLSDSPYFKMGILDSMGLFLALIIAIVILLPLFLLRALFTNPLLAIIGLGLLLFCLYIFYQCIEKILFELFIINLPY